MDDSFVIISSFQNPIDAEIAKGRLESEGIASHVRDGELVSMNWLYSNAIGGVKLLVHASDQARARQLLNLGPVVDDEGWGACPNCGGRHLEPRTDRRITNLTWLLFGLPLLFPRTQFYCRDCGTWTKSPAE